MKTWIAKNWKQVLVIAVSVVVGALLHFGKLTTDQAIGIASVCAAVGIRLMPIGYGSPTSTKEAVKEVVSSAVDVVIDEEKAP